MRKRELFPAVLLGAAVCSAEIIDRVAATVGNLIITQSAIVEQLRVAAFLNGQRADESAANRRRMAERMVEQTLIRREMEISRYDAPTADEVDKMLAPIRKAHGGTSETLAAALRSHGIDEQALRRNLVLQLATLRFIEVRFRPGASVAEGEIEIYYRDNFLPEWQRANPEKPPPLIEEMHDVIEDQLRRAKIDQALDEWLKESRSRTRIAFFEEAFR